MSDSKKFNLKQKLGQALPIIWQNLAVPSLVLFIIASCNIWFATVDWYEGSTEFINLIPTQIVSTLSLFLPISLIITIFLLNRKTTSSRTEATESAPSPNKILSQQGRYWLWQGGGLLLAYLLRLSAGHLISSAQAPFYYLSLYLIAYGGLLIFPWLNKKKELSFGDFLIELITQGFFTGLISLIVLVGGNLIIFSLSELILTGSDFSDLYFYFNLLIGSFLAPTYFLSRLSIFQNPSATQSQALSFKIITNLALYLGLPIFGLYNLVLYLYAGKILLTATWPEGMITWLVLVDLIIGFALIFLLKPLVSLKSQWQKIYRLIPFSLIIPLLMMSAAVFIRISEYSFTPNRYYLCLIIIWAVISLAYLILSRQKKTWLTIAFALAICLITAAGPLNAINFSAAQQEKQIKQVLKQHQLTPDQIEQLDLTTLPETELKTMNTGRNFYIYYKNAFPEWLNNYYSQKAYQDFNPGSTINDSRQPKEIETSNSVNFYNNGDQQAHQLADQSWFVPSHDFDGGRIDLDQAIGLEWLTDDQLLIEVRDADGEKMAAFDFTTPIQTLLEQSQSSYNDLDSEKMTFTVQDQLGSTSSAQVFFDQVRVKTDSTIPQTNYDGSAIIFLKLDPQVYNRPSINNSEPASQF